MSLCYVPVNQPRVGGLFEYLFHRSGELKPEDLEQEYGEQVDFLFAKLKLAKDNKEVRM